MPAIETYISQYAFDQLSEIAKDQSRPVSDIAGEMISNALEVRSRNESRLDALTRRERQIVGYLELGFSNRDIADELVISPETVKCHVRNIFQKTGVKKREEFRRMY